MMMKRVFFVCAFLFLQQTLFAQKDRMPYDIYIQNACVFDGTLNDSTFRDVAIIGDKIVYVGKPLKKVNAKKIIDAKGLYLTPGFIDPHTHADSALHSKDKLKRANLAYLSQGVTTVFLGNDGWGDFNVANELNSFQQNGTGTNVAAFVGFGPVRQEVLQNKNVLPNATELAKMEWLVEKAMKEGAMGISTGLSYIPQNFSTTKELIELSKIVSKYGGTYDTHMRNQSTGSIKAIDENLEIGRVAKIPIHISHIKASGPAAHGLSTTIINQIAKAREEGLEVTASVYPYLAAGDDLSILIPVWAKRTGVAQMLESFKKQDSLPIIKDWIKKRVNTLGGADKLRLYYPKNAFYHGNNLAQMVAKQGKPVEDVVVEALTKHPTMEVHSFVMDENDLINFMKQSFIMTCSDGVEGHPRATGSFVKKIREFTLDQKLLTMKFAIHTSTGLTADFFKVKNRGYIKEGYFADLVIFDPETIKDNANYSNPFDLATGINYVIVNGKPALVDGKFQGTLLGKTLKLNE